MSKKTKNSYSCSWPSCHRQPKTLSFRTSNNTFMFTNSIFLDAAESTLEFTSSLESSADHEYESNQPDAIETIIRGLRSSKRLFFDPRGSTRSILEETYIPFKGSTMLLAVDTGDPRGDFRKSMEEMVQAHGFNAMDELVELLSWYLKANHKNNHGFVFGAFVDLLSASTTCDHHQESLTSPLSFCDSSSYESSS